MSPRPSQVLIPIPTKRRRTRKRWSLAYREGAQLINYDCDLDLQLRENDAAAMFVAAIVDAVEKMRTASEIQFQFQFRPTWNMNAERATS